MIDYETFCGITNDIESDISPEELQELITNGIDFQLIDVREPHEYELDNLGGELMPLSRLEEFVPLIQRNKQVIVHCQSGMRSQKAIALLKGKFGFTQLFNLVGGISAYRKF